MLININQIEIFHSFLRQKKPSPVQSASKQTVILARAGRATNSLRVKPVMFPAECFEIEFESLVFSFPFSNDVFIEVIDALPPVYEFLTVKMTSPLTKILTVGGLF